MKEKTIAPYTFYSLAVNNLFFQTEDKVQSTDDFTFTLYRAYGLVEGEVIDYYGQYGVK